MGKTLINRKRLMIAWGDYSFAKRKWKYRHHPRSQAVYVQVGPLEIAVWFR